MFISRFDPAIIGLARAAGTVSGRDGNAPTFMFQMCVRRPSQGWLSERMVG